VPETPLAPPPASQNVTVVVSPSPATGTVSQWKRWTSLGAFFGLLLGVAGGWYYHSKLPGEFESTARLTVTGPAPAADAETQQSILRSKTVLTAAAKKLDDLRPFEMPPPKADDERVAFLNRGIRISSEPTTGGSALNVRFRGPHPADTPKYLRAVVDAYKSELSGRTVTTVPTPRPASASPTPSPAVPMTNADRDRLEKELAAFTPDDPATIEKRITAEQGEADKLKVQLRAIDKDLGLIKAAGPSRRERLAAMEELGLKPERVAIDPGAAAAEAKSAEDALKSLQLKKAELGQRLGPEHRDMVALDEQIAVLRDRIAKAKPEVADGPDELDRHKAKLEADRKPLADRAALLSTKIASDQKLLDQVNALRAKLDATPVKQPAPAPAAPKKSPVVAAAPETQTYAVQAIVPTDEAKRVSPPWEQSLVPGGAIGLLSGAFLGLIGSLLLTGSSKPRKRAKATRPIVAPVVRTSSPVVPITSGPRLGVPVFANVPTIRPDAPLEKRPGEGLSPLLFMYTRPSSPEAEMFRHARRELVHALHNRGHQVVPVTSPGPGEGKSLVAANLAVALAQSGKRVLLLDADLASPHMQDLFRLTRLGDSLKSIMAADVDLRMAVRTCEVPNLFLLPAGRGPMDPVDLLNRPKFRELLAELKASYEYVIIDAPETQSEHEFSAVTAICDGVVLVVRNGADAAARTDRAKNQVIAAGSRVLGAIVNAAPPAPEAATPVKPKELVAVG
jgi:capsular exopolysaccharide synthesis family protein